MKCFLLLGYFIHRSHGTSRPSLLFGTSEQTNFPFDRVISFQTATSSDRTSRAPYSTQPFDTNKLSMQLGGCFPKNSEGYDDVPFDPNAVDNHYLRISRYLIIAISFPSLILNALLVYLVYVKRRTMKAMFPVLMFGAVSDFFFGLINMIFSPHLKLKTCGRLAFCEYFRTFPLTYYLTDNGLVHIDNDRLSGFMCTVTGCLVWISWIVLPLQFAYRMNLLVHGKTPTDMKLVVYVVLTLLACGIAIPNNVNFYFYQTPSFINPAKNILHNAGYIDVNPIKIRGAAYSETRFWIFMGCAYVVCETCYAIIIYVERAIRRHLKQLQALTENRAIDSINRDVGRALIALSIPPFFNSVLSSLYILFSTLHCADMGVANIVCSVLYVTAPLANPLSTIILVKPYRYSLMRMIGIKIDEKALSFLGGSSQISQQRFTRAGRGTTQVAPADSNDFRTI
ncbi:hypothetical protein M3Y98_01043400 [Aphelenchoides besseyi]|nr:hypothetical protein M3Y98_01043400 [Aphelenchoides besseyi]